MKQRVPAKERAVRFILLTLPAAAILVGGILIGFVILIHRITHPEPARESVTPTQYFLPATDVSWTSRDGFEVSGWWIPGVKGAPAIVLSPGYGMSKADVLSLAAALRQYRFNLLVYDQRGSGQTPRGPSFLGLKEEDDMEAALDFVRSRIDPVETPIGIWGVDVGARAALKAAAVDTGVRAIAADSAFEKISDFVSVRVREELGWEDAIVRFCSRQILKLYLFVSAASLTEGIGLDALATRSILFIQGENRRAMARLTAELRDRFKPPKEMVLLRGSRTRWMNEDELKQYDRYVTSFFHLNLPGSKTRR